MGLRSLIAGAVATAFVAIGDLKESVSYYAYSASSSYDPDTGNVTRTETLTTVSGKFLQYSAREIDGEVIKPRDEKFIFQQASLATDPIPNDRLVFGGKTWEVVGVTQDPAGATWELQVRSING